jgi:hypothetical protein
MRRFALVVAALALVGAALAYQHVRGLASVGAGYVAKELCSCVFVGGRSLESCALDVPETMARVRSELLPDGVRAFVTGFALRVARHEPGFGCTLVSR